MMATEPQPPITDALLGKYLAGEASQVEAERVRQWLTDPANEREYNRLARIWSAAEMLKPTKTVNTEAAWQRVRTQMHQPPVSPAGPTVRPMPVTVSRPNWLVYSRVAAVLALAVLVGVSVWRFWKTTNSVPTVALLSATTKTNTQQLRLPDGSRVLLNRNSRLTYPAAFADSTREVVLTGEAFFDVAHNPAHPFRVRAGQAVVRVLGTSFNVRAVGDSVRVAVRTGRVQLLARRQAVVLTTNQQATYVTRTDTIRKPVALNANLLAYQARRLSFAGASLGGVVQTLREVYGTDIRLSSTALNNCRLTADFGNEPIDVVLSVVAETLSLTVRREGEVRVLTGTGCGL